LRISCSSGREAVLDRPREPALAPAAVLRGGKYEHTSSEPGSEELATAIATTG
jgi:hypothetical protein